LKLFRYYKAEHALLVLSDLEIRTSIPNTLNDPFELSPNIDPSQFTQKMCERALSNDYNVDDAYYREAAVRGFTNKKAFKRWYLKEVPRRAAELLPKVPQNVETVRKNFADSFSKRWRLVCASRVSDSILMWSHYAADHTGVVIEFDTGEQPFSQLDDLTFPVTYSEKKPDYIHYNKYPDFQKAMFTVAATKAADWGYEKEVRIIVACGTPLRDNRYMPISPASITAVLCGCRMPGVMKLQVRAALKRPQLAHVQLMQAVLDRSEYALTFNEESLTGS
jgi:Protein of unknown function (DUF2971)